MAKNSNIASVLAFEKKLVPSDGFLYGTTWQERNKSEACKSLELREKSVRGTISNRLKPAIKDDPLKCPKIGIDSFGQSFNDKFDQILLTNQIGIMKK